MITMETIRKRALALAEVTFDEAFEIDAGTVAYIRDVLTLCVYVLCVILSRCYYGDIDIFIDNSLLTLSCR